MRRISVGVALATAGVFVSWIGQAAWRDSPDSLWAAVAVVSVLCGAAIAMQPEVSRLLSPITKR